MILTVNCNASPWSVTQSVTLPVSLGTHVVASLTAVWHLGTLWVVGELHVAAPWVGVDAGSGGGAKLTLDRHLARGVRPAGAVVAAVTFLWWPGWDCYSSSSCTTWWCSSSLSEFSASSSSSGTAKHGTWKGIWINELMLVSFQCTSTEDLNGLLYIYVRITNSATSTIVCKIETLRFWVDKTKRNKYWEEILHYAFTQSRGINWGVPGSRTALSQTNLYVFFPAGTHTDQSNALPNKLTWTFHGAGEMCSLGPFQTRVAATCNVPREQRVNVNVR